jgi:hypothetical protein
MAPRASVTLQCTVLLTCMSGRRLQYVLQAEEHTRTGS